MGPEDLNLRILGGALCLFLAVSLSCQQEVVCFSGTTNKTHLYSHWGLNKVLCFQSLCGFCSWYSKQVNRNKAEELLRNEVGLLFYVFPLWIIRKTLFFPPLK